MKKDKREKRENAGKDLLPILLIGVSAAIFLFAAVQLAAYCLKSRQEEELDRELRNIRQQTEMTLNEEDAASQEGDGKEKTADSRQKAQHAKEEFLKVNEDYVAWLEIPDTGIAYPVVQRDNEFYLTHDFKREKNQHGAIFLDEVCTQDAVVWLIHGHHMKDGTMFGGLKQFEKKEYIAEHRNIFLDTGEGDEAYRIYAVVLLDFSQETEEKKAFHYEELPQIREKFEVYLEKIRKNAFWYDDAMDKELEKTAEELSGRKMIILSTCEYGTALQRLIVVAVREREK